MLALGFIETKGLLASIEGADAMVKAADVSLLEKSTVGGGLVTITVGGDVASVRAAVDAGVAAIKRVDADALVSEHVIARPHSDLKQIISVCTSDCEGSVAETVETKTVVEETITENEQLELVETVAEPPVATEIILKSSIDELSVHAEESKQKDAAFATPAPPEISQLKKMTVSKLRKIARSLDNISLDKKEIKFVKKKSLIDAIIKAYRQIEE